MVPHTYQDDAPHQNVQKWFVAFTSYRGQNPLYKLLLGKGFGHVFVFSKLADGVLLIDPQEGGVLVYSVNPPGGKQHGPHLSAFIKALMLKLPDLTLIEVPGVKPQGHKHPAMFFPSCVTAIKAVLCRQSWAVTPKGLFNRLVRDGGNVIDKTRLKTLCEADITASQQKIDFCI